MSLETMAFVLGGLLICAGVFGGGLEVKELKLPQIGGAARFISGVAGISFVVLALAINLQWVPNGSDPVSRTFPAPMYDGVRLDACFTWAERCGEEAATAWCKDQGYIRAIEFPIENVGERGASTKLIGTQQICRESFCASFAQITCTR
jgi:hypothetical protein